MSAEKREVSVVRTADDGLVVRAVDSLLAVRPSVANVICVVPVDR